LAKNPKDRRTYPAVESEGESGRYSPGLDDKVALVFEKVILNQ
jgi:hypothetical protein